MSHTLMGMKLKDDDIAEFRNLWQQEFGEPLSPADAHVRASQLLELYVVLARPFPKPEHETENGEIPAHLT